MLKGGIKAVTPYQACFPRVHFKRNRIKERDFGLNESVLEAAIDGLLHTTFKLCRYLVRVVTKTKYSFKIESLHKSIIIVITSKQGIN